MSQPWEQVLVKYPNARRVWVLYWYDYYAGHHALVCPREDLVQVGFARLLREHKSDLEIRGYWVGDAVGVPAWVKEQVVTRRRDGLIWAFKNWVADQAEKYRKVKRKPPAWLKRCTKFVVGEGDDAAEPDDDHGGCARCYRKFYLADGDSWEQRWALAGYPDVHHHYELRTSAGSRVPKGKELPPGIGDGPLMVFSDEFGDHSKGLNQSVIHDRDYPGQQDPVLLLERFEELDAEPFRARIVALKAAWDAGQVARKAADEKRWAQRELDEIEVARAFFEDGKVPA